MEEIKINSPDEITPKKDNDKKFICNCDKCNGKEVAQATYYRHKKNNSFNRVAGGSSPLSSNSPKSPATTPLEENPFGNFDDLIPDSIKNSMPDIPDGDIKIFPKDQQQPNITNKNQVVALPLDGLGNSIVEILKFADEIKIKVNDDRICVNDFVEIPARSKHLKAFGKAFDGYCKAKDIRFKSSPEIILLTAAIPICIPYVQLGLMSGSAKANKENKAAEQKFKEKYGMSYEEFKAQQEQVGE